MKNLIFLVFLVLCRLIFADQPEQEILRMRDKGDFQKESLLRSDLENLLMNVQDPTEKTSLKRHLYMETIPLPADLFFDTHVSALAADNDDIWVGSRSGDIARYSLSERHWKSFAKGQESLAIRTVQSIKSDKENVWILSYGSVAVYSKRHNRFFPLSLPDAGEFRGLQSAVLMGNGLICGTQGTELRRIRLDGYSTIHQVPKLRNITYLKLLDQNSILAGTEEDGLFLLDSRYQPHALSVNNRQSSAVRVVLNNGPDKMIAGSYGSGLFLLTKNNGKYDIVFLGTDAKWITGGVAISGFYCFSTLGEGLVVLNRKSLEPVSYGISEGLAGLNIMAVTYVKPYVICAVQGQGLVRIHENFFKRP